MRLHADGLGVRPTNAGKLRGLELKEEKARGLQMNYAQVAPFRLEIFHDKPAMAVLSCCLAAKQHRRHSKEVWAETLLDLPLSHEGKKSLFVV